MREKAKAHIELHIRMYKHSIKTGRVANLDFQQARIVGLISMAKELELITVEEYLDYLKIAELR